MNLQRVFAVLLIMTFIQSRMAEYGNDVDLLAPDDFSSFDDNNFYRTEDEPEFFQMKATPSWKTQRNGPFTGINQKFPSSLLNHLVNNYAFMKKDKTQESSFPISARGFYGDVFTDGFGTFHTVKRLPRSMEFKQKIALEDHFLPTDDKPLNLEMALNDGYEEQNKQPNYTTTMSESGRQKRDTANEKANWLETPDGFDKKFGDENSEESSPLKCYLYFLKQARNKRIYMDGLKRFGFHLQNPSIFKKTPHRHVGVFNGDAFHSGLGTFETLKKRNNYPFDNY